jgi:YfiH family protein
VTVAWIEPDWPRVAGVRAAFTLRDGGVSPPPWGSLNLGRQVGDDAARVAENRRRVATALGLPATPAWLEQVHGREVLELTAARLPPRRRADGAVTGRSGRVLAVQTADCLPVLMAARDGARIGVAHAGWRGLAAGVLEAAVAAMDVPPPRLQAWLGPAIGMSAYEVGPEVREQCLAGAPDADGAFRPGRADRWHLDLAGLARHRLAALGVAVHGGQWCTASDSDRFFSYRRDGPTGRMAALIWLSG